MAGVFQTIDDAVRVAANGLTFGLPDYLEGAGAAERSAAARERLGLAGDAVNAASYLVGGAGALKGAAAAWKARKALGAAVGRTAGAVKSGGSAAARAIPAAERAAARKVVPGYAARENALARLDLPQMRTVSGSIGSAIAARPKTAAAGAAALGLGTAAGYNSRNYDARAAAPTQSMPQMKTALAAEAPQEPTARSIDDIVNGFMGSEQAATQPAQPTWQDIAASIAEQQGGRLSLNQLNQLGEFAQRTTPRGSGRQPKPGDQALALLEAFNLDQLEKDRAELGDAQAWENFRTRSLELSKVASPMDLQLADYYEGR